MDGELRGLFLTLLIGTSLCMIYFWDRPKGRK
jgi:hypothetical protein